MLCALAERTVLGAGWDGLLYLFRQDAETGVWSKECVLGEISKHVNSKSVRCMHASMRGRWVGERGREGGDGRNFLESV